MRFSTSPLIKGIIEDVDVVNIRPSSHNTYRDISKGLDDLINSIDEKGILQPILVTPRIDYFQIVSGHRRYYACKKLGLKKIVCHILELDDKEAFEISLVENIQRKNLNSIEEAQAFRDYTINYGWGGISDLARKIGKSVSYIERRIKLLGLSQDILNSVCNSSLSTTAAEEIVYLKDKNRQSELARVVCNERLSSRFVRKLVNDFNNTSYCDMDDSTGSKSVEYNEVNKRVLRSFDKSIVALRIAMNKISYVIEEIEDNWVIYQTLMHHKNVLHEQIDILLKEKKKV